MKRILLSMMTLVLGLTASAQSALDADFESGELPSGWTVSVPESPYKGGFSAVTPDSWSKNQKAGIGTGSIYGTYVMMSKTGGTNAVKGNSDNWFISPEFTVGTDNIFSFIFGANCSYSPTKEAAEKMKMEIVVISGDTKTVIGTIAPENYFTWKQFAYDLSAYSGKTIKVAFHDYGTAGSGAIADMKFIDNIKLSSEKVSDYSIVEVEPIHGQALFTQPYTLKVTNYGVSTGSFTANYSYGSTTVSETVNETIASGDSVKYTFKKAPSFTPGENVTFKAWVSGSGDTMNANDTITYADLAICSVESLPYSVCNQIDTLTDIYGNDSIAINSDVIGDEFAKIKTMVTKNSTVYWWPYDAAKYHAWIFEQADSTETYRGIAYLYSKRALSLPAGKVYLTTIGTGTGPDMHYEVYISKYWDSDMTSDTTYVGISPMIPDARESGVAYSYVTTELNIPEAGEYTFAIRPLTTYLAQMTIIGYAVSTENPAGIDEVNESAVKTQNSPYYNLTGQRVNSSTKGIIIRNGKKYFVK